jgi:hypothetical protein
MKPQIKIIIDESGDVKAEGIGFKGASCDAAMKFLEELGQTTKNVRKADYYLRETTTKISVAR